MENQFSKELIEKAKEAKSTAEIQSIAKENGIEITSEEAVQYFTRLCLPSGDIMDEELENVAGGGCHISDGRLVVTAMNTCEYWSCVQCGHDREPHIADPYFCSTAFFVCGSCGHCSNEGGLLLCNHPAQHS